MSFFFPMRVLARLSKDDVHRSDNLDTKQLNQTKKKFKNFSMLEWLRSFIPSKELESPYQTRQELSGALAQIKKSHQLKGFFISHAFPSWSKTFFVFLLTLVTLGLCFTGLGALVQIGALGGTVAALLAGGWTLKAFGAFMMLGLTGKLSLALLTGLAGYLACLGVNELFKPAAIKRLIGVLPPHVYWDTRLSKHLIEYPWSPTFSQWLSFLPFVRDFTYLYKKERAPFKKALPNFFKTLTNPFRLARHVLELIVVTLLMLADMGAPTRSATGRGQISSPWRQWIKQGILALEGFANVPLQAGESLLELFMVNILLSGFVNLGRLMGECFQLGYQKIKSGSQESQRAQTPVPVTATVSTVPPPSSGYSSTLVSGAPAPQQTASPLEDLKNFNFPQDFPVSVYFAETGDLLQDVQSGKNLEAYLAVYASEIWGQVNVDQLKQQGRYHIILDALKNFTPQECCTFPVLRLCLIAHGMGKAGLEALLNKIGSRGQNMVNLPTVLELRQELLGSKQLSPPF